MAKKKSRAAPDRGLEARLNDTIARCLWEPGGDPDDPLLATAADAYKILKEKGLKVRSEESVVRCLRGENIEEEDYLADMDQPPAVTPTPKEAAAPAEQPPATALPVRRLVLKCNTTSLERQVELLSNSADGLRSASADGMLSNVADVLDQVHGILEEVCNVFDEAEIVEESEAPGDGRRDT